MRQAKRVRSSVHETVSSDFEAFRADLVRHLEALARALAPEGGTLQVGSYAALETSSVRGARRTA